MLPSDVVFFVRSLPRRAEVSRFRLRGASCSKGSTGTGESLLGSSSGEDGGGEGSCSCRCGTSKVAAEDASAATIDGCEGGPTVV